MPDFYVTAKWEVFGEIKVEARNLKEALDKVQDIEPEVLQRYNKQADVVANTVKPCREVMAEVIMDSICDRLNDVIEAHPDKQQILEEIANYTDVTNPTPSVLEVFHKIFRQVGERIYRENPTGNWS